MSDVPKAEELAKVDHRPPELKGWMDIPVEIRPGIACYGSKPKNLEYVGLPNPREWSPFEEDWKLPDNWKEIFLEGMKERLDKFRTFFYRRRGSEKHAGYEGRTTQVDLPKRIHDRREGFRSPGRCERTHGRCPERTLVLPVPMYGMSTLLSFLPIRHRHGGDHHFRA